MIRPSILVTDREAIKKQIKGLIMKLIHAEKEENIYGKDTYREFQPGADMAVRAVLPHEAGRACCRTAFSRNAGSRRQTE